MAAKDPEDARMSLGDHLDELRKRLLLGIAGPLVIAVAMGFFFSEGLIELLTEPAKAALRANGYSDRLTYLHPLDLFNAWMKVCILTGIVLGVPWLFYQLWLFVAPGLYKHEKLIVYRIIPGSLVLSIAGIAFMYFVLLPALFGFLLVFAEGFSSPQDEIVPVAPYIGTLPKAPVLDADPKDHKAGDFWVRKWDRRLVFDTGGGEIVGLQLQKIHQFEPNWTLDYVMGLVTMLGLAFAIAFQLPLVMLTLGWVGVLSHRQFAGARRYAVLLCVVVSAIITPTSDAVTLAYMAIPLYLLYEFGIILTRLFASPRAEDGDAAVD